MRGGENALKTSATALPILLTIAAALLGLANNGICNVLVSLCRLGGGGGSPGGGVIVKSGRHRERAIFKAFLCFWCYSTFPTVHQGGKNEQKVLI